MNDDVITISSPQGDATAHILPRRGFNCFGLQVRKGGESVDVLWSAHDFVSGQARPSSSGIPILFPFPGRLSGTSLEYSGRRYELDAGDGRGNAIHGFVLDRTWKILEQSTAHVVGELIASRDAPDALHRWPSDYRLVATYRVDAGALTLKIEVENVGRESLPFGLGLHPYFRVPLGGPDAASCQITVPAQDCWELHDMLPTGRKIPAAAAGLPPDGLTFGQAQFDHVFDDLTVREGRCHTAISDPGSGRTMELEFDATFRECVLYTPGHREAFCIEPYTCVPDAYRLQAAGCDTGLRVLNPGDKFAAGLTIRVR